MTFAPSVDNAACDLEELLEAMGFNLSSLPAADRQRAISVFVPARHLLWTSKKERLRQRFAAMERRHFATIYATLQSLPSFQAVGRL